ncbi:type II toxin-antitoxin system RelE/ParE family toxin [Streptomyces sp. NPDC005576]|uniref:type II toxin-antitoxin system RelE/ParE family toxin n=1 Tax=Streptomyces sp. NPDC005576 TaxID=3364726 RepID=UPI0036CB36E3
MTAPQEEGPVLGRPLVDTIKGSVLPNLKELRPGSAGTTEVRLVFVFDPNAKP